MKNGDIVEKLPTNCRKCGAPMQNTQHDIVGPDGHLKVTGMDYTCLGGAHTYATWDMTDKVWRYVEDDGPSDPYQYIRIVYGVPARRHARVKYMGRPGTIVDTDGGTLVVELDHERDGSGGGKVICHPTYMMTYEPQDKGGKTNGR